MRSFSATSARRVLLAGLLLLLALSVPSVAHADYRELLRDACNDGVVNGTYSQKDYRQALANVPADAIQYTNCADAIRAAQAASASAQGGSHGGGGSHSSGGGPTATASGTPSAPPAPATKAEQTATAQAVKGGERPVLVAGASVDPSALGAGRAVASSISDLPRALLVALGLIAAGVVAALAMYLVPRVRDRLGS